MWIEENNSTYLSLCLGDSTMEAGDCQDAKTRSLRTRRRLRQGHSSQASPASQNLDMSSCPTVQNRSLSKRRRSARPDRQHSCQESSVPAASASSSVLSPDLDTASPTVPIVDRSEQVLTCYSASSPRSSSSARHLLPRGLLLVALVLLALASSASALPRVAKRDLVETWPEQLLLEEAGARSGSLEAVPPRDLEQYDDAPGMAAETTSYLSYNPSSEEVSEEDPLSDRLQWSSRPRISSRIDRRRLRRKTRRSTRGRLARTARTDHCAADASGLKTRVCQNCAKITRTRNAYATCCYNVNNAYGWCKRIYDFTNPLG